MMHTDEMMFALIRQAFGVREKVSVEGPVSAEQLSELYALSKSHDMAHIVAQALGDLGLLGEDAVSAKFQKQQMLAVYRYQQIQHELDRVCKVLESAKIAFVPLKGSVIRAFYPEPWMRTSCDIDILVHEQDLDSACNALEQQMGYESHGRSSHDVSLYSAGGVHLELHYSLVEENRANHASGLLDCIWNYAFPIEEHTYQRALSDGMYYFYHIAHMAKHFEVGGCGVRPFLDLWILKTKVEHNETERNALLEKGGLLTFANACRHLSDVWFEGDAPNETDQVLAHYILTGGTYGNLENNVAVQQQKKGGKLRYVWHRLFLPYSNLKYLFPILQKHPWLTPVMQVRRWFRIVRDGRLKRSVNELKINQSLSPQQKDQTVQMLKDIGLL